MDSQTDDTSQGQGQAEELEIIELEQFDTAFAVSADQSAAVKRRFMTLFVDSNQTRLYGSSGTVSKASNAHGEVFAIKRLRPDAGVTPPVAEGESRFSKTQLSAFREEYRAQIQLSHMKGFPRLYGYGVADGDPVIIMEWVEGTTLDRARHELPHRTDSLAVEPRVVAQIGRDLFSILEGLSMLAERPVHRDLSPSNIMLRTHERSIRQQVSDGRFDICLIDFGSATVLGSADPRLTLAANIWRNGTPEYAPPEMLTLDVAGIETLRQSPSIDVYAASSVLYELLCGRTPFRVGERMGELTPYRIKTENPPDPIGADYGALGLAIMGGLRSNQERRYGAAAIRQLCVDFLNGKTTMASMGSSQPMRAASTSSQPTVVRNAMPANAGNGGNVGNVGNAQYQQGAILPVADYEVAHLSMPNAHQAIAPAVNEYRRPARQAAGYVQPGAPYAQRPPATQSSPIEQPKSVSRRGFVIGAVVLAGAAIIGGTGYGISRIASNNNGGLGGVLGTSTADSSSSSSQSTAIPTAAYTGGTLYAAKDTNTQLWGFLNSQRAWVIEPRFTEAPGLFSQGLAFAVDSDANLAGFIDYTGEWAIKPQFGSAMGTSFSQDGLACVISTTSSDLSQGQANRIGWIDTNGAWVVPPTFIGGGMFYDGLASCSSQVDSSSRELWGWIDKRGSFAIPERFFGAGAFTEDGLARAKGNSVHWGWVDRSGNWVIEAQYAHNGTFHEGLAAAADAVTEVWGFVDKSNTMVIPSQFANARWFNDGRAACQDSGSKLWGMIDTSGNWVIQPVFRKLGELSHGLAPAQDDGTELYGYVDDQGEWVIPPQFADVGLASLE